MLGKVFGIIALMAFGYGLCRGEGAALGEAVLDGAASAVELTLSLGGMMCLWCGILRVLREAGLIGRLTRLCAPLLRLAFPHAARTGEGMEEIAANLSANLLGLGNAATPAALRAMGAMAAGNPEPERATDDMVTLVVLNTASVSLIPTTVLTIRHAAGAAEPYAVLVPIWICSAAAAVFGVLLCRLCAACGREKP